MIGAIIGDIAGSRFEWANHKSKEFELFTTDCRPTDDSIMTIAVGKAIMEAKKQKFSDQNQSVKVIGKTDPMDLTFLDQWVIIDLDSIENTFMLHLSRHNY